MSRISFLHDIYVMDVVTFFFVYSVYMCCSNSVSINYEKQNRFLLTNVVCADDSLYIHILYIYFCSFPFYNNTDSLYHLDSPFVMSLYVEFSSFIAHFFVFFLLSYLSTLRCTHFVLKTIKHS